MKSTSLLFSKKKKCMNRLALEDYVIRGLWASPGPGPGPGQGPSQCPASSTPDASLQFTVEVLRARLDGSRTAISPLSFFTLSKVGFASGLGTILTYIIVLMQFKASEPAGITN